VTLPGIELEMMLRVKFSLSSSTVSLFIGTSNGKLVTPTGNVTVYGPES